MRALVTGGAGLVGSSIIDSLLLDGHEVLSLDNYVSGKSENLSFARDFENFQELRGDILDEALLNSIFSSGIDWVFHQAVSKNTVCMIDPIKDLSVNAIGTLKLLQFARDHRISKFIHASTGSVYGNAKYYPTNEDHPRAPVSFYGNSKLAAENYVSLFNEFYDLPTVILRYFHVFGSRQDSSDVGGVIPIFVRRALTNQDILITGDGSQVRAFTSVHDIAKINIKLAALEEAVGEIYNCASNNRITINQAALDILEILEKPKSKLKYVAERIGDIKKFEISNEALIKALPGFEFSSFEIALMQTISEMKTMSFQ